VHKELRTHAVFLPAITSRRELTKEIFVSTSAALRRTYAAVNDSQRNLDRADKLSSRRRAAAMHVDEV